MRITIKTLNQVIFKVDIELDKSVKELKETIEQEQGKEYPVGAQKLIYGGKILADENKLAEYELDEKRFVVLMITKPPPAPKPVVDSEKEEQHFNFSSKKVAKRTGTIIPGTERHSTRATPVSGTATTSSSSAPTVSSAASTAATATSDAAQSSRTTQPSQSPPGRGAITSDMAALAAQMTGEPQMAARLATLMSHSLFRQMQDIVQHSPHLLSSSIDSLASADPEMYNFITENPDVFISALNIPPPPQSRTGPPSSGQRQSSQARTGSQQAVSVQGGAGGGGGGGSQPVMDRMLGDGVSEHDKEAIERLKELGFSEYLAVQAYMACDKDEQLAANLLFQMDQ